MTEIASKIARIQGFQKGLEEGKIEGLQEGLERGLLQGINQGEYNKAVEIAKKMYSMQIAAELIYKITGIAQNKWQCN